MLNVTHIIETFTKSDLTQFLQYTLGVLLCALVGTTIIYPMFKKIAKRREQDRQVKCLMEREGITKEEAIDMVLAEKIKKLFKIDEASLTVDGTLLNKDDIITFQDESKRYYTGELVGFKKSRAEGYTYHYVLLKNIDNKVISKPIETIVAGTLSIVNK